MGRETGFHGPGTVKGWRIIRRTAILHPSFFLDSMPQRRSLRPERPVSFPAPVRSGVRLACCGNRGYIGGMARTSCPSFRPGGRACGSCLIVRELSVAPLMPFHRSEPGRLAEGNANTGSHAGPERKPHRSGCDSFSGGCRWRNGAGTRRMASTRSRRSMPPSWIQGEAGCADRGRCLWSGRWTRKHCYHGRSGSDHRVTEADDGWADA